MSSKLFFINIIIIIQSMNKKQQKKYNICIFYNKTTVNKQPEKW